MKSFFTKSIVGILIGAVLAPTVFLLTPQKAQAQTGLLGCIAGALGIEIGGSALGAAAGIAGAGLGVFVPVLDLSNYDATLSNTGRTAVTTAALTFKECVLDALVWVLKEIIISGITASLLEWIANGFDGAPTFITDFGGFARELADDAAGAFLLGDEFAFMCQPFQGGIQFSVGLNFSHQFRDNIQCSLSDVVTNIQGFIDGFQIGFDINGNSTVQRQTFTQSGGLAALRRAFLNPANTPVGAFLLAERATYANIARKQEIELFKVDVGNGYASIGTCLLRDNNGNCVRSEIQLPGKFVEGYVAKWIGQQTAEGLNLADEIDEIVGALLQQLTNMLLQKGIGLLAGGTATGAGGESFADQLRGAQDLRGRLAVSVSFFASPQTVTAGGSSQLTWNAVNATACTASGGWTGAQASNGNFTVTPTETTTYTITCTSSQGGAPQTKSVTVDVSTGTTVPPPPPPPPPPTTGGTATAGTTTTPPPPPPPPPDNTAPANISNLAVSGVQRTQLTLTWTAPGDDDNTGTATSYDIRFISSTATLGESEWRVGGGASSLTGEPAPQAAGTIQTMVITGLLPLTQYVFAMKTTDDAGNTSPISNQTIPVTTLP